MPADRRITINVSAEGHRDQHGDYVPGAVTPIAAWASRRDVSQELKVSRDGTRDLASRDWRVRWDSRIANSPARLLKVVDEGVEFIIVNMAEVTQQRERGAPELRRKFIDLEGVFST